MLVREIMTEDPLCCGPDDNIQDVARMMVECDCGNIPVVDEQQRPIGVITDRDITCRVVAEGRDPMQCTASDVMTTPVVTVTAFADVAESGQLMQDNMIRRIVVVDEEGCACGIITMADIALAAPGFTEDIVGEISQPTDQPSNVH